MRHGDGSGFLDHRMAVKSVLDVLRREVLAATDYQILLAAGDDQGVLGRAQSDIARTEKTFDVETFRGLFGVCIAEEQGGPAGENLAFLAEEDLGAQNLPRS